MLLKRRVALNGEQLDELNDWIVIRRVEDTSASETITAVDTIGGAGQRITGAHFGPMEVSVTWAMDIHSGAAAARRELFEQVVRWANRKGWLTAGERENRRLYVDRTIFPDQGDIRDWTGDYEITFRAYNVPFWQQERPESFTTGIGSNLYASLQNAGNMESVLDIRFRNMSGAEINTIDITADSGANIQIREMGLQANETLEIWHGVDGILRVTAGGRSILEKVLPGSSDDLTCAPGAVHVSARAQRAGEMTVNCYGRFI